MDPDYGFRLLNTDTDYRLRSTDRNNFGHDRLMMDQDLPHFYAVNFSRYLRVEHLSYQALIG